MITLQSTYDVTVIGGGINGTAIAAEAARRGLSVLLCQSKDLASGYSGMNPYLVSAFPERATTFNFPGTYCAIQDQRFLGQLAPHLLTPLNAIGILPKPSSWRWTVAASLINSWQRAPNKHTFHESPTHAEAPHSDALHPGVLHTGHLIDTIGPHFEFTEFGVKDYRLVIANALQAKDNGATIAPRHRVTGGARVDNQWQLTLEATNPQSNIVQKRSVTCQCIINASGWWVQSNQDELLPKQSRGRAKRLRLDHIIIPNHLGIDKNLTVYSKSSGNTKPLYLTPVDERWLHVGPLITGHPPEDETPHQHFATLLLEQHNQLLNKTFTTEDIRHHRWGFRAICDDVSITDMNEHVLDIECPDGKSPLLSIYGGNLTAHRRMANQAMNLLKPYLNNLKREQPQTRLPGGEFKYWDEFFDELTTAYPELSEKFLFNLANRYGARTYSLLGDIQSEDDLGHHFGHGFYEKELCYLINEEWVLTAEDALWRRTDFGLYFDELQVSKLDQWIEKNLGNKNT
ncbi:FAD-dependent oxidoreductase [Marinibactrum halimedae]|uniref:Glycerol-3-phosphate dehydrogenase n=1 Tax=Marinibactrum halimedae TaxID=1444977 RepID=A0AA37WLA6_9GAMM|nr:FAD-dependent oxidoreductase [Marinibactrum halimedae]MCD9461093.1 FAD-dependent oxidoreductase [Marinibactrum halimedae]GLS25744.1 glycerol-3-phosphate dehydrogenase [Marinibactrum halimedae]